MIIMREVSQGGEQRWAAGVRRDRSHKDSFTAIGIR